MSRQQLARPPCFGSPECEHFYEENCPYKDECLTAANERELSNL